MFLTLYLNNFLDHKIIPMFVLNNHINYIAALEKVQKIKSIEAS